MQAKSLIRGTQRRQLSSPNRSSLGKAEAKQQLRGKSPSDVFCFCQFYPFLNSLFFACYKIPSSSFSNPTLNQTQLHNLLHFSHQPSSLLFQVFFLFFLSIGFLFLAFFRSAPLFFHFTSLLFLHPSCFDSCVSSSFQFLGGGFLFIPILGGRFWFFTCEAS